MDIVNYHIFYSVRIYFALIEHFLHLLKIYLNILNCLTFGYCEIWKNWTQNLQKNHLKGSFRLVTVCCKNAVGHWKFLFFSEHNVMSLCCRSLKSLNKPKAVKLHAQNDEKGKTTVFDPLDSLLLLLCMLWSSSLCRNRVCFLPNVGRRLCV